MTGWFLQQVEIEGFRGVNNEGSPLILKFKTDHVNSISAPNGVGKSSVFEALQYALTGRIAKLDRLAAAEAAGGYYLNKFHAGGVGSVKLTLVPEGAGSSRVISVTRTAEGARSASCSDGSNAESALAELNREFVLLDSETFQNFISCSSLERGRSFAGLLGLASYSTLRQGLQSLANTRSFNGHFEDSKHKAQLASAKRRVDQLTDSTNANYLALVKEPIAGAATLDAAYKKAANSLAQIALLAPICEKKAFKDIDVEACIAAVKAAEAGPDRLRLATIIQHASDWSSLIDKQPDEQTGRKLAQLARNRDKALSATNGDLLRQLYELGHKIVGADSWADKNACPACEGLGESSLLDSLRKKLDHYTAVEQASENIAIAWKGDGWAAVADLEQKVISEGETNQFRSAGGRISSQGLTEGATTALLQRLAILKGRAGTALKALSQERDERAARLPPSLVTLTETVEAARQLQQSWAQLELASLELKAEATWAERTIRLKTFLDEASAVFSKAEADAGSRRLLAVEPLCQQMFATIIHDPVVPALKKRSGSEEMSISLARFFSLDSGSAQALLSESFRNAFSASVYLAAATLYGGAPRFLFFDDVTSSFDAGHQFHLMEVIRTRFARPQVAAGPQVILLSHDTLLEKLFNRNASSGGWWHQRLQGSPRTSVLTQSNAVDKVAIRTRELLNAGRADDAAPFIRQYLEFKLEEVVQRCRIPVPFDLSFNESKQLAQGFLDAIGSAVELHRKGGTLVLNSGQQSALNAHVAAITGNYLAHWGTGSSHNFSASALLGVMQAIDDFADCFRFSDPPATPLRYYKSLSQRD